MQHAKQCTEPQRSRQVPATLDWSCLQCCTSVCALSPDLPNWCRRQELRTEQDPHPAEHACSSCAWAPPPSPCCHADKLVEHLLCSHAQIPLCRRGSGCHAGSQTEPHLASAAELSVAAAACDASGTRAAAGASACAAPAAAFPMPDACMHAGGSWPWLRHPLYYKSEASTCARMA